MVGKKYIVQCPAQKSIEQTKKKKLESEREKERETRIPVLICMWVCDNNLILFHFLFGMFLLFTQLDIAFE